MLELEHGQCWRSWNKASAGGVGARLVLEELASAGGVS